MSNKNYLIEIVSDGDGIVLDFKQSLKDARQAYDEWMRLRSEGHFEGTVTLISAQVTPQGDILNRQEVPHLETEYFTPKALMSRIVMNFSTAVLPFMLFKGKSKASK
jgi:hypothetical protein